MIMKDEVILFESTRGKINTGVTKLDLRISLAVTSLLGLDLNIGLAVEEGISPGVTLGPVFV